MKRFFLILLLCTAVHLPLSSQTRLLVHESDKSRVALLSRTASIDSRHDSTFIVYANDKELKALHALGFRCTPLPEQQPKALTMATTLDEMRQWNRYPTYEVYLQLMQELAANHPTLCHVDTIGTTMEGRLILCLRLTSQALPDSQKPQFFYSSSIHGDEITGYYLMLRLADTLLSGYGVNAAYSALLDSIQVYINPLANPDGTYHGGNATVSGAQRYNANSVDLNRNFPDPFGSDPMDPQQTENTAMIAYVQAHHFRLSANLHGGSEILNYPWDSFESSERQHPSAAWWAAVSKKFIDTMRSCSALTFTDVCPEGYITGGDWYVIPNGRQDWMNSAVGCLEMTMELSVTKELPVEQLPTYWNGLQHSLVNYIHAAIGDTSFLPSDTTVRIALPTPAAWRVYPNPTTGRVVLSGTDPQDNAPVELFDMSGKRLWLRPADTAETTIDQPAGIYLLRQGSRHARIIKL